MQENPSCGREDGSQLPVPACWHFVNGWALTLGTSNQSETAEVGENL